MGTHARSNDVAPHYDGILVCVALCYLSWQLRRNDEQPPHDHVMMMLEEACRRRRRAEQVGFLDYKVDSVHELDAILLTDRVALQDHAILQLTFLKEMRHMTINGRPVDDVYKEHGGVRPTHLVVVSCPHAELLVNNSFAAVRTVLLKKSHGIQISCTIFRR